MIKLLAALAFAAAIGVPSAHAAGQCPGDVGYVNDGLIKPQKPRDGQLTRFRERMVTYQGFHGASLVLGESHSAMYPQFQLKQLFNTGGANIANFGADGATVEEVWWMINRSQLADTFDDPTHPGQKVTVSPIDLSHVTQVFIPTFGGNSLLRTTDSADTIAQQEQAMIARVRSLVAPGARILVTERMEGGPEACWRYEEIRLNDLMRAAAAQSGSGFDYRDTPRGYVTTGTADGAPHCGFRNPVPGGPIDYYYFRQESPAHYTDAFYGDFVTPVAQAYFANQASPTPRGTINDTCKPDVPPPGGPAIYQGPGG